MSLDRRTDPWNRLTLSWGVILVGCALPAFADVADVMLAERVSGGHFQLWRAFGVELPGWLFWAMLAPAVAVLAHVAPLRGALTMSRRASYVAIHLVASAGAAVIHAAVLTWSARLFDPGQIAVSAGQSYAVTLIEHLPLSMLFYWVVLGGLYAIATAREHRVERLRAAELEGQVTRAELTALRAQLHPHFLFNAINAAVSLVRVGEPAQGIAVLTNLSELLRQLLQGDARAEVSLAEEISLLERYLDIERARFRHRLQVAVQVPSDLTCALVPSLVLQPLVENAVRHGIAVVDGPGIITVDASSREELSGDMLVLTVRDNGPGLDRVPSSGSSKSSMGIGVTNTRERLHRLHGGNARLELVNREHGGVEATIILPLKRA